VSGTLGVWCCLFRAFPVVIFSPRAIIPFREGKLAIFISLDRIVGLFALSLPLIYKEREQEEVLYFLKFTLSLSK